MFWKKKPATTGTANVPVDNAHVTVRKENYFALNVDEHGVPTPIDHSTFYLAPPYKTYREAHALAVARIAELEQFLEDMLTIDPRFERFGRGKSARLPSDSGTWDTARTHAAAELIRADAREQEIRTDIKFLSDK